MECMHDDCENEATYGYTWAWGEEGACCAYHKVIVEQTSQRLNRSVSFTAVGSPATMPPASSWDRAGLEKALRMATAELQEKIPLLGEAQMRVLELEELNKELTAELGKLRRSAAVTATESPDSAEPPHETRSPPVKLPLKHSKERA